jgi:hypothetical protein
MDKKLKNVRIIEDLPRQEKVSIDVLLPLLYEINLIEDETVKSFVKSLLLKASDFWSAPFVDESSSEIYEEEGTTLVNFTKLAVHYVRLIGACYDVSPLEMDMITAAALLQDITSISSDDEFFVYDPLHPYTVDSFFLHSVDMDIKYGGDDDPSCVFIDEDIVGGILRVIRCHMGKKSAIPETHPITYLDMALYVANNIASDVMIKVLNFSQEETEDEDVNG